ncbi:hypothetical protein F2Q68_00006612 [Brassica cretica]|uniref:Uncharacterized protein n=1 Tax=Brassica cretica TaxID=69181 RepID=A0A8S9JJT1_BRACR|nr:hypothetical protein F2Q68_00006612 [Brassica cretica]
MDSVSGYAGPRQPRTGGKIVRPRRTSVVRTPYDRPAPRSRDPPQQNPSWISRLVYKPATAIASGAGKFISSVVFSESSSSSSEGEDSSSGMCCLTQSFPLLTVCNKIHLCSDKISLKD